ncbi:bile acid:sodium symporter family protein [Candidatus Nitrosacidococcus tergens]|uniref:Putative sodium/bile acid symporter family (MazG-like) n=1 Tax=Candidatus Nitrosacidococcus tergens TaxID=553981 RepID=A0A7G1Q787_9GAMM|nr:bile acid:sodium symporter family protein [Candidatus Nitrosacidococcus tergens]CAB1274215.1 putative sodium/bile acid symporter family (mazG-like) [Candidatus Nitrosacidococcus tergens]
MLKLLRLLFSGLTLLLIGIVIFATLFPISGSDAVILEQITTFAIVLLFFMHGAKLSRSAIVAGITHWRLHSLIFIFTFGIFPLIGFITLPFIEPLIGFSLSVGVLFLCTLPSTVQSAIAFTSIARGNVPAAICNASASSIIGIVLTPLIFSLMVEVHPNENQPLLTPIIEISEKLLLPFLIGHLMRPLIGNFVETHARLVHSIDQTSILLIVYSAFNESVINGIWHQIPMESLFILTITCSILLAIVLTATTWLAHYFHFNKEDEITIVFCGSKKSLASGVPIAQVMFGGGSSAITIGPILLPIMIFHQIQLMVCAALAEHYAARLE